MNKDQNSNFIAQYLESLPQIEKHLQVIARKLPSAETEIPRLSIKDSIDILCLECPLRRDKVCEICPANAVAQMIECNEKIMVDFGPNSNAKITVEIIKGRPLFGFKINGNLIKGYATAEIAYNALCRYSKDLIFKK